jgi:hypothetical protein
VSFRKGEITKRRIDRDWPHQVEVPAEAVAGHNYDIVHAFCRGLSVAPRGGRSARRDDRDWLRYCFATPADADAFHARFGGRRVTVRDEGRRMIDLFH